ncbi:hypothetical protein N658DRAFT_91118 [Parathielavia hyrcaniae]|uniref:Extracellular membrane protein CFEM domain-containing protein n=1 Tax=Parathielavia hyrcaniae TaxID=113614 RepID=A0AAN6T1H7_9PEZI|nr:hypothetical protein N658DRAFT_91118 [Parathielavia hyrcaniae]
MRSTTIAAVFVAGFSPVQAMGRSLVGAHLQRRECPDDPTQGTPACNKLMDILTPCSESTTKEDTVACFCVQNVLNLMVECKGEVRECAGGYAFDADHDESIALWREKCDQYLTFTPTTPVLTSLTTVIDVEECTSIVEACLRRDAGVSSCSQSHSANAEEQVSCLCRPSQLWAASRCFVDRTDCAFKMESIALSRVPEYRSCSPSGWVDPGITQTANNSAAITSYHSPTPTPTLSTLSFGPAVTTTQTQSAAIQRWAVVPLLVLVAPLVGFCFR